MDPVHHTILIVDDEPNVAKVTGQVLGSELHCEILLCSSPHDAIEVLRTHTISLVFCDLFMPGIDGTLVLEKAHALNPDTVTVLVTGRATKDAVVRAMNSANLWRLIEKPWRPDELLEVAREGLRKYEENIALRQARQTQSIPELAPTTPKSGSRKIVIKRDTSSQPRTRVLTGGSRSRMLRNRLQGREIHIRRPPSGTLHDTDKSRTGGRKIVLRPKGEAPPLAPDAPGAAPETPAAPADVASLIDKRFKIVARIREGGSGSIFRAEDTLLGMPVAIKVLSADFTANEDSMATLISEARIAMQLSHKHIVRLHNISESQGLYYLVMEFIDGVTLRDVLAKDGNLALDTVVQIAEVCADALGYAHRRHVYHRDLKPDNLMLTSDGVLKIIDFGLSCLAGTPTDGSEIAGTPFYMSPEEIHGTGIDQRSDIYSLAVMLHELLTGHLPLPDGHDPDNILDVVPEVSPAVPEPLAGVLRKALALDKQDRWSDVDAFITAFKAAAQVLQAG